MFPNQLSDRAYGHLINGQLLCLQCYVQVRGHNLHQVTQDGNCLYNSVWHGLAMQSLITNLITFVVKWPSLVWNISIVLWIMSSPS